MPPKDPSEPPATPVASTPPKRPSSGTLAAVQRHAQKIAEEFSRCLAVSERGAACTLPRDHAAVSTWLRRHRDEHGREWE